MALQRRLYAKEDRRPETRTGEKVDPVFLSLVLLLLGVGLVMLYSASFAQSYYDTGYQSSTRYLARQAFCAVLGLIAMAVMSRIHVDVW